MVSWFSSPVNSLASVCLSLVAESALAEYWEPSVCLKAVLVRLVLLEDVLPNRPFLLQSVSPTLPSPGQDDAPEVMYLWC